MTPLRQLLEERLRDKTSGVVGVATLYGAVVKMPKFLRIVDGLFLPSIGVIGDWSEAEKNAVKEIATVREHAETRGYLEASLFFGDDSYVAMHKSAYTMLTGMRPGAIAKVSVGSSEYFMAAFPTDNPLSNTLVLFAK
jgi:hypothetical protein